MLEDPSKFSYRARRPCYDHCPLRISLWIKGVDKMSAEDAGATVQQVMEQLDELDFSDVTLGQLGDIKHPVLRKLIAERVRLTGASQHTSHSSHDSSL
jgi:hypothetical protein